MKPFVRFFLIVFSAGLFVCSLHAQTWDNQTSGTGSELRAVSFVNTNTGWVVGILDTILHTTDGGDTWMAQSSGTINHLECVTFLDASYGWALGSSGTILHTTNGGETWTAQISGTTHVLRGVAFTDANHGWAVGESGTILRYNANGQATDEHFIFQPSSFVLSAFPNPFNSSTTMSYDLPKAASISLRVFDLLGREVAVLKDGFSQAGTHRVTFDGSGLASGIYFARLDVGSFSQMKKLILLK
jgi:hypothetical protein